MLSWDRQDWQVVGFKIDPESKARGSGRAEFTYRNGETHRYSLPLEHAALTIHITGESYRGVKARKLASKKKDA